MGEAYRRIAFLQGYDNVLVDQTELGPDVVPFISTRDRSGMYMLRPDIRCHAGCFQIVQAEHSQSSKYALER